MTVFNFNKKMKCGKTCLEDFEKEIIKLYPSAIGSQNFHIHILHSQPLHKVEVVFYDKGVHESIHENKIKSQKFTHPLQKKYTGKIPKLADLQKL